MALFRLSDAESCLKRSGRHKPDRLVSNYYVLPIFHLVDNSLDLLLNNSNCFTSLSLLVSVRLKPSTTGNLYLKGLSTAENHTNTTIDSGFCFAGDDLQVKLSYVHLSWSIIGPTSSVSLKSCLRSLCPKIVQVIPASFNCDTETSPVNAPSGLS